VAVELAGLAGKVLKIQDRLLGEQPQDQFTLFNLVPEKVKGVALTLEAKVCYPLLFAQV
jgi:hypothetical protein